MRLRRSGVALITVLLMSSILLMMVIALYISLRGSLFSSMGHMRRTSALYVAEAGLADTMQWLEDANFVSPTAPLTGTLASGGTWTVTFNNLGPPYTSLESVNNLENAAGAVDSFRGPATVPPSSALIVVVARMGGVERVLEAIITRGGASVNVSNAIQTSGHLVMQGDVEIDGIKSLDDSTAVPGNLHSNATSGTSILWDPQGGTAAITGTVSAVGGTIDLAGYTPGGGAPSTGPAAGFPAVDIPGTIAAKATSPAPTFNPSGPTNIPMGEFYQSGDVVVNGDLHLSGTNLYVNGNLTVNGSISGDGSVYVQGETTFRGDARLGAAPDEKVALFSRGSVALQGFDGTAYLDGLAATDPVLATSWTAVQNSLQEVQSALGSAPAASYVGISSSPAWARFMQARRVLGSDSATVDSTYNGYAENSVGILRSRIPAGVTGDFMRTKLDDINMMFHSTQVDAAGNAPIPATNEELVDMFLDGTLTPGHGGPFDAAMVLPLPTTPERMKAVAHLTNMTNQIDYDRLGSSYFRGLIYTDGYLYADNEVTIVGALMVQGDPSLPSATLGGVTINPGDILLGKSTRVTYVEKFFESPVGATGSTVTVQSWLGR